LAVACSVRDQAPGRGPAAEAPAPRRPRLAPGRPRQRAQRSGRWRRRRSDGTRPDFASGTRVRARRVAKAAKDSEGRCGSEPGGRALD